MSQENSFISGTAFMLRDLHKASQYSNASLPMTILRRCYLFRDKYAAIKPAAVRFKDDPDLMNLQLQRVAGLPYDSTHPWTLKKHLGPPADLHHSSKVNNGEGIESPLEGTNPADNPLVKKIRTTDSDDEECLVPLRKAGITYYLSLTEKIRLKVTERIAVEAVQADAAVIRKVNL